MSYYFRLSMFLIRTVALYFILLLLPRYALGDLPSTGNYILMNLVLHEFNWHVENNTAVIDSVRITGWEQLGWGRPGGGYPCKDQYLYHGGAQKIGAFRSCTVYRYLGSNYTVFGTFTSLTQLTVDQLRVFFEQTGPMGPATSNTGKAYFGMVFTGTTGTMGAILPRDADAGGGVPPIEVDPPASCSLSNGKINHGVIDSAITDGNVSRTNLSLSCSKSATVRIIANAYKPANGVALSGPGGLRSFVTLNGVAADPGITVKANNSASISVESTLRGTGNIAAGSYSGSIILVATII